MILTKDNLIKFIQESKYVTPTDISKAFSTTTLVASAALSQLVDQKIIGVTYLKVGSTPYYYDLKQREGLQELAEKHLSKNELLIYKKLKAEKIINDSSLTAVEKLVIKKIKDFAMLLEIEYNNLNIKFWVWYLLDLEKTRQEILDGLKSYKSNNKQSGSTTLDNDILSNKNSFSSEENKLNNKSNINMNSLLNNPVNSSTEKRGNKNYGNFNFINSNTRTFSNNNDNLVDKNFELDNSLKSVNFSKTNKSTKNSNSKKLEEEEEQKELIIERFLIDNLFKIENKESNKNVIIYNLVYLNNPFQIKFEAIFFKKKVSEVEIFKYYSKGNLPLLIISEKVSKKIKDLGSKLDNLFILEL